MSTQAVPEWDPVRLAVLTNRMQSIVRRMTNTLFRTARSAILNTARDFSACIVTADDELLVAADSLPIHVMSGPELTTRWLKQLHPVVRRGDAFLHNSPYHGNSHAGDHCIVVPVVDEDGVHRFTAIVKAHISDIGNSQPTTLMATATDVYNEGALIFPCVRVQEDYRDVEDIIRMCQVRIRVPEVWYGDYLGMVGAARIAERELLALGAEEGWDALEQYCRDWFDYSEQLMIEEIRQLPRGLVTVHTIHDPIPLPGVEEGVPLEVTVEVDPDEARIEVDFRDNPDCVPCGINLTEATARTAGMIGIFNSLSHQVPQNGGAFRRLTVHLRENCCAGIPVHPASCATATFGISDRLGGAVQRAISELKDGFGMAEAGAECSASTADISGRDPRRGGRPFVNLTILGMTGGAGHPKGDGWLTNGELGDGGAMMRDSTEVVEYLYPVRIWADRIVADTAGAGRYRGAPSCYVEYGPASAPMHAMWAADGCVNPALGARGGLEGACATQFRRKLDGSLEPAPPWGDEQLEAGETVIAFSTAGGGYGPPWERDVERVLKDLREGWITRGHAEAVYGVVCDEAGALDEAATAARREALASGAVAVAAPPRGLVGEPGRELIGRYERAVACGRPARG